MSGCATCFYTRYRDLCHGDHHLGWEALCALTGEACSPDWCQDYEPREEEE